MYKSRLPPGFGLETSALENKYDPVQNVPGHVVFFTKFLRKLGFRIDSDKAYTAVPIAVAKQYNLA